MTPDIVAYIIYFLLTIYIIYWVGQLFYRKGYVFILNLYQGNQSAASATNKLLLTAYYLFNIGYAFVSIRSWNHIVDYTHLVTILSAQVGLLILILAITHYFNMLIIYIISRNKQSILYHKKQMS